MSPDPPPRKIRRLKPGARAECWQDAAGLVAVYVLQRELPAAAEEDLERLIQIRIALVEFVTRAQIENKGAFQLEAAKQIVRPWEVVPPEERSAYTMEQCARAADLMRAHWETIRELACRKMEGTFPTTYPDYLQLIMTLEERLTGQPQSLTPREQLETRCGFLLPDGQFCGKNTVFQDTSGTPLCDDHQPRGEE